METNATNDGPEDDDEKDNERDDDDRDSFDPAEDCHDPDWWEDNFDSDPVD